VKNYTQRNKKAKNNKKGIISFTCGKIITLVQPGNFCQIMEWLNTAYENKNSSKGNTKASPQETIINPILI